MNRHSQDPLERIEWQLDQIRGAVVAVAVMILLAAFGAVIVAAAA